MKEQLRKLFGIGWAMVNFRFMFLSRRWAADKHRLANSLKKLREFGSQYWLLIFPEGTTYHPSTVEKSNEYAAKNGLKPFNNLLIPRYMGLCACFQALDGHVDGLVDVTICIDGLKGGDIPEDVFSLVNMFFYGRQPNALHFYMRYVDRSKIPVKTTWVDEKNEKEEMMFQAWLYELFKGKDEILDKFYNGDRSGGFEIEGIPASIRKLVVAAWVLIPVVSVWFMLYVVKIY